MSEQRKGSAYRPTDPSSDLLAAHATATLVTGPALFAGIGWLVDRWLGTGPWLLLVGLLGGMALSLYSLYVRYGTSGQPSASPGKPRSPERSERPDGS